MSTTFFLKSPNDEIFPCLNSLVKLAMLELLNYQDFFIKNSIKLQHFNCKEIGESSYSS
jgi:hypothetical protein